MLSLKILPIVIMIVPLLFFSCTKEEKISSKDELLLFMDTLELKYEDACVQLGQAYWNFYSQEGNADNEAAKEKFKIIFQDTLTKNIINLWLNRSGSLADELLARRLEIWDKCFIGGSIYSDSTISYYENKIQHKISNYKYYYAGQPITNAEISNNLRTETSQKRRQSYWTLPAGLSNEVKNDLITLVKIRNEKSKAFGYSNYYSLMLGLQTIREDWLLNTMNELEMKSRDIFDKFIVSSEKKIKVRDFKVWDFDAAVYRWSSISDNYFPKDSIFRVIDNFTNRIGFNSDSLPIKRIVRDIPFGGLNVGIKIPADSRLIVNPYHGKRFYNMAFHEYGHALHCVNVQAEYPILKGYEWIPGSFNAAYAEGLADLMAEFVNDPEWMEMYLKISHDDVDKYLATRSFEDVYYLRRMLKDFFFEYEMYKNPDQDLDSLEKVMYEKYLLIKPEEDIPTRFASSIWYTMYPCYFHNYVLSKMIASQVFEVLINKFGSGRLNSPLVADWLIRYLYHDGELEDWQVRIRNATGKSLETGAYLRRLKVMN